MTDAPSPTEDWPQPVKSDLALADVELRLKQTRHIKGHEPPACSSRR